jgi:amino acid transporter
MYSPISFPEADLLTCGVKANKAKTGAAASPFVVAITLVGIKVRTHFSVRKPYLNIYVQVLNHVINAAVLLFVLSAANSDLYIGSRTLYGMALEGKAPRIFAHVNRRGVPWPALIFCLLFCALVFLNLAASASQGELLSLRSGSSLTHTVKSYLVNLVSTFGAITW